MIKTTIDYVQMVRDEIIFCDEFCHDLAKWLKAVNKDAPSAEEIKNEVQRLYQMGEDSVIQSLTERTSDSHDDKDLVDYSIESNDGFNLKIRFLVNEKAKELTGVKVGLRFKS